MNSKQHNRSGADSHQQRSYGRGANRGRVHGRYRNTQGAPDWGLVQGHSSRSDRDHPIAAQSSLSGPGGVPCKKRPRRFGYQYVCALVEKEDLEEVIMDLSKDKDGFFELLCGDVSDDTVVLIVKLLRKVCSCSFRNVVVDVVGTTLKSKFVDRLLLYMIQIINQDAHAKRFNQLFWQNPNELWDNLIHVAKAALDIMPSVSCACVEKIAQTMNMCFPSLESHAPVSDDVKTNAADLLAHVKHVIQEMEVKKSAPEKRSRHGDDNEPPPDHFRDIPIFPTSAEVISRQSPYLRRNIVDRPYDSVEQYLDIQFRLLREDFVSPLRKGICTYLEDQHKPRGERRRLENIRVYKVKFTNYEVQNEYNCYTLQFDFGERKRNFKFENSKRFMFGSLVCFTEDSFATLLFGIIVNRDMKLLEKSELMVGFHDEVRIDLNTEFIMIESSVYFEPYYQVLGVLQRMNTSNFPMKKYIIDVTTDSSPPRYLLHGDPVLYEIENHSVCPLYIPRELNFYGLNESQLAAFNAALSREFCIIQGPPGTGKTYLGLKIAHTLLANHRVWYKNTPMLVICFTNHALDQFLEGIVPLTTRILRVGGQSKSQALDEFNIRKKRTRTANPAFIQKTKELKNTLGKVKFISDILANIDSKACVIDFSAFSEVIDEYNESWFDSAYPRDIEAWLLSGRRNHSFERRISEAQPINMSVDEDDIILDENETNNSEDIVLISLDAWRKYIEDLDNELVALDKNLDGKKLSDFLKRESVFNKLQETRSNLQYVEFRLTEFGQNPFNRMRPEYLNLQHPENMLPDQRWQLYFYWLDLYTTFLRTEYRTLVNKYQRIYQVYNELRDIEDIQLMKDHLVVGMTTTGAARLQSSIQTLKSPIVIVEEAAEVLEAHIVAALTGSCRHLILIGDHLQLKPSAADYKIETDYGLGTSLFERMVNNRIQCYTLNVQHRMRPEISSLIKPAIYRDLLDHESTQHRPPVSGLQKPLFFIDHRHEEQLCQDESKKNLHEAQFLVALARHLVLNGYEPNQITILAAYLGQMYEMMGEKRKAMNHTLLQGLRIAVLDNYQGEESDIILLSLVRNNADNKIGFLRIQNRVCVALSRARNGFYVMGNMEMLCAAKSESDIWKTVKKTLEDQNAIGFHLPLKCQIHPYKITHVSLHDDFLKLAEGGCDALCETLLSCGHICKKLCHVQDRDHNLYQCREKCTKELCNDPSHICKKMCYEECGLCCYPVERSLDCGHVVELDCYIDPQMHKCKVLVFTKLPCEHSSNKPCGIDPNEFLCPHPCDTRVEPCGHACRRPCHVRLDPDHLEYECREPCSKPRAGCREPNDSHVCPKLCFENCERCDVKTKKFRSCGHVFEIACHLDVETDLKCEKPCKKRLHCGHPCRSECWQTCEPCKVLVQKIVPECGHTAKVPCSEEPARHHCQEWQCPRLLSCGHPCKKKCSQPCTSRCTEIVDCSIDSPCGHVIKRIKCNLRDTRDPAILLGNCSEPCSTVLKCEHKCCGTCGVCLQGRIHAKCGEKCGAILVCNHECPSACRDACMPCTKPCEMKCQHSRCKKKCGEPCTPCSNRCPRRCAHQRCKKLCGQICSVPPCTKRCGKKLKKCGHQCVGFCGDPCPRLCRHCDKDELTEIFLGNEDEEDAIYVMLKDCGHVFESGDMERWLNADYSEIKLKVCPRCKTNITTTERYSDHTKRAMGDVIEVKRKAYGDSEANGNTRMELLQKTLILEEMFSNAKGMIEFFKSVFRLIQDRLYEAKRQRRQPINAMELNSIGWKLQCLEGILKCCERRPPLSTGDDRGFKDQVSLLEVALSRNNDHVSDQEREDLGLEIDRLQRIVQFAKIKSKRDALLPIVNQISTELYSKERYTPERDAKVKKLLEELSSTTISDREKREIIEAMKMGQGHWFRCPNGHVYAIGECGGAMQVSKCNECGATIGGTNHRLLEGQTFAPDFDGATQPAWPGVHM
ncbi:NFX1-type zinc finger-containing protein 1-like isoform X2 [Cylas formicarius]|uniref:NFX1-type zinc finger-containing protein 1-like isoform X2 n=1 Tax=Cylas formicarius TaxID=197179 RepID=UPI002958D9DD|nr:NFX1-type zinc finger-containing protein 1-like isoform X2 [Cylas formicarius]